MGLAIFTQLKDYMLTYQRLDKSKIIRYTDFDYVGYQDSMKSRLD